MSDNSKNPQTEEEKIRSHGKFTGDSALYISQQQIMPGAIKPLHLLPNPGTTGAIYYNKDANFAEVSIGNTGEVLGVSGGVPTWQNIPQTGIASARPTAGSYTGHMYFATDSHVLSIWDGGTWRTTTLT